MISKKRKLFARFWTIVQFRFKSFNENYPLLFCAFRQCKSIAQRFLHCLNALNIASQNDTSPDNHKTPRDELKSPISALTLNNKKILHYNTNINNEVALFIESFKPKLNNGLKAR